MNTEEQIIKDCEERDYKIKAITDIASLNAKAIELLHPASGARILHIHCPDRENCFCVALPTPPPNDTGMPHILEHMTLAGSEKYRCKEPFFEMIKRSVATFINAMTGNDITYYPVCSTVKADLFNLAEVYFDAVFHPLLSQSTFDREAYHLAPADAENPHGDLKYDGIVYSEMKGVFSSPEGILERDSIRKLLPDTCHGKESGGNPDAIPELTLEELRAFHATNYHPSNAYIVFYGDTPTTEWLDFLSPRLEGYTAITPLPPPARQVKWDAPRTYTSEYPIPAEEETKDKSYLMLNWLIGSSTDLALSARLGILSYLLVGNDGSPLKKAIIDSHVGANLILACSSPNGLELTYHLAVDGAEPDAIETYRKVVFDKLKELSEKPFEQNEIDAAFQQVIYSCTEIGTHHALNVATNAVGAWMAGLDPTSLLERMPYYEAVRKEIEQDPMLLSDMIKTLFIDNTHRLDIILKPSHTVEAKEKSKLENQLAAIRARLSDAELDQISENARKLEEMNAKPNTEEDLLCLPQLKLSDISPTPYEIPTFTTTTDVGKPFVATEGLPTNDIVYLTLSFDISDLPEELWEYVPRFNGAVSDFGTKGHSYSETAGMRAAACGVLSSNFASRVTTTSDATYLPSIDFRLKTTTTSLDRALGLLHDAIFELDPEDKSRMADLLIQDRAVLRSDFVQDARNTTRTHSARTFTLPAHHTNLTSGLPTLYLLDELASIDIDEAYNRSAEKILQIRDFLLDPTRVTVALVGPDTVRSKVLNTVNKWLGEMKTQQRRPPVSSFIPNLTPKQEGLFAALQVSFSALTAPAPHTSHPDSVAFRVGASVISSDYMLPEIRFKGNAYGAGLTYAPLASLMGFMTYRDPHIVESYETMMRTADFVKNASWDKATVENAILTIVRQYETPVRPTVASTQILNRTLCKTTAEARAERYSRLLKLTPEEVREVTERVITESLKKTSYCVAASEAALQKAREAIPTLTMEPIIKG